MSWSRRPHQTILMSVEEIQNQKNQSQPFTTPTSTTDVLSRSKGYDAGSLFGRLLNHQEGAIRTVEP
jgi:hypothetical protein